MEEKDFIDSINDRGYYQSPLSFGPYKRKYGLNLKQKTPQYISIDFWSRQTRTLRESGLYVMRIGRGKFVIFDEKRFPRPYLNLDVKNAKDLHSNEAAGPEYLKKAFRDHYQENPSLEYLHLNGIYEQLAGELCGTKDFFIGPRGNRTSAFKIYFKDVSNDFTAFSYDGQEELDYSIWTDDTVLLFEAKQAQNGRAGGLDIGWHKLAYPAYRFAKYEGLNVIPIYHLRVNDMIYLFVFDRLEFYEDGVIVNDTSRFTPRRTYRIDLIPESRITKFNAEGNRLP